VDAGGQPRAGTATVLLARVDGPAGLRDSGPGTLAAAAAFLDETAAGHGGVRSAAHDDGGDFVAVFPAAPEAVACALDVQRAPLAPVRLRVCLHTGETRSPHGDGGPGPC
jgi:class 3 adenylate cyclase